ncbi:MAG TPA: LytTR family DNA-binding domain-containing protein [Gemmatimonadaceae bacterium]|jgi:two-component system LytT family response regulator|nr:LytTR family DNA-binding domain-containing protein [Gemmatimonadaceae bacterium]
MMADADLPELVPEPKSGLPPIRILIVDDEALGRLRVHDLVRDEQGVEVVGQAADGDAAVKAIRELKPDLVFLDVQMPKRSGLDVVKEIGAEQMPMTIFVTAYDRYALEAFDVAALDYLVKPFDDDRFEQAFRRARRSLALEGVDRARAQLLAMLRASEIGPQKSVPRPGASSSTTYLERIAVEMHGQVKPIPVAQIDYISAAGPYAELHVGDRRYVIREAMQTLEDRLDPNHFMRVHRSVIVRLDLVEALHRGGGGDYELQMKGGVRLRVSRSRREGLERWLGISPRE